MTFAGWLEIDYWKENGRPIRVDIRVDVGRSYTNRNSYWILDSIYSWSDIYLSVLKARKFAQSLTHYIYIYIYIYKIDFTNTVHGLYIFNCSDSFWWLLSTENVSYGSLMIALLSLAFSVSLFLSLSLYIYIILSESISIFFTFFLPSISLSLYIYIYIYIYCCIQYFPRLFLYRHLKLS